MPASPFESLMSMEPPQSTETEEMDEPESSKPTASKMRSIKIPEGLKTPEGHAEGDTFQGTFRGYIKDGELCFRSINNIPLPGGEEGESEKDEESESPEEESIEEESGIEQSPSDDKEDKVWKSKQRENSAFKKAFNG